MGDANRRHALNQEVIEGVQKAAVVRLIICELPRAEVLDLAVNQILRLLLSIRAGICL